MAGKPSDSSARSDRSAVPSASRVGVACPFPAVIRLDVW